MRTCHHAAVGDENAFVSIAKREANSHMFLVKAQLLKAFNVQRLILFFLISLVCVIIMEIEGFEKEALAVGQAHLLKSLDQFGNIRESLA